jgi:hypothetical protein
MSLNSTSDGDRFFTDVSPLRVRSLKQDPVAVFSFGLNPGNLFEMLLFKKMNCLMRELLL